MKLQEITDKNGLRSTLDLSYDKFGNKIEEKETKNNKVSITNYKHNFKTNQLIQVTNNDGTIDMTYDKYGNMIQKSYSNGLVEDYTFDDSNQLIKQEDNYNKVIEYTYDGFRERIQRTEEFPHDYLTIVPQKSVNTDTEYNIDSIISNALNSVNKVVDNKYFCTVTDSSTNTKVMSETYVNDILSKYTQVLEVHKDDATKESYTYGYTRISNTINNDKSFNIINAKLDIIGSVRDDKISWSTYDLNGNIT